jgi:hypothetical protein
MIVALQHGEKPPLLSDVYFAQRDNPFGCAQMLFNGLAVRLLSLPRVRTTPSDAKAFRGA